MNAREKQLIERDVRKEAPEQNSSEFLRRYLVSNFPQTSSIPNTEQRNQKLPMNNAENTLKLDNKPLSGTQYDNPGLT